jgi:hypothetical protein
MGVEAMSHDLDDRIRQLSEGLPREKDRLDLSQLINAFGVAEVRLEPTDTSSNVVAAGVAVRGRRKAIDLKPGDHDPPAVLRICGKMKRLQLYVRWGREYPEVLSELAELILLKRRSKLENTQGAFFKMEDFRATIPALAAFFKCMSELT